MGRECGGFVSGLGVTPPPVAGVADTPFEYEGTEVDIGVLSLEPGLPDIVPTLEIVGAVSIHTELQVAPYVLWLCSTNFNLHCLEPLASEGT